MQPEQDGGPLANHTLGNIELLVAAAGSLELAPEAMPEIADKLVKHVHPSAPALLDRWAESIENGAEENQELGRKMMHRYRAAYDFMRQYYAFENVDPAMQAKFYDPRHPPLCIRREGSRKLLVIFGTMFNNFGVSFAGFVAMLRQLDCSVLILKENYSYFFLNGVRGFAPSMPEIGAAIAAFARTNGYADVYVTGYSSGGFPALTAALTAGSKGYVGFSQTVNIDLEADLVEQREALVASGKVPRAHTVNLPKLLVEVNGAVPCLLYYGSKSSRDKRQASDAASFPGVRMTEVAETGHNIIPTLMADGTFLKIYADLINSQPQLPEPSEVSFAHMID